VIGVEWWATPPPWGVVKVAFKVSDLVSGGGSLDAREEEGGGGRDVGPAAALEALSRILAVGTERAARAAKETLEQRARDLELLQVFRGLSSYQLY